MSVGLALGLTLAIAIGTYLLRAVPLLVLADRQLPGVVQRALRNVGPAVLAALAVVSIAAGSDGVEIELAEVVALVTAGVVAWWRRNLIWSFAAGMCALWITLALHG